MGGGPMKAASCQEDCATAGATAEVRPMLESSRVGNRVRCTCTLVHSVFFCSQNHTVCHLRSSMVSFTVETAAVCMPALLNSYNLSRTLFSWTVFGHGCHWVTSFLMINSLQRCRHRAS